MPHPCLRWTHLDLLHLAVDVDVGTTTLWNVDSRQYSYLPQLGQGGTYCVSLSLWSKEATTC